MTTLDTNRSATAPVTGGYTMSFFGAMKSYDTARSNSAPVLATVFNSVFGTLRAWNDARVTRKSLNKLSARELEDIGLCRGDIDMIAARGGRF